MSIKNINIDVYKTKVSSIGMITRQGEQGQQIRIRAYENGDPLNLNSQFSVRLKGVNPQGNYIDLGSVSTGTIGQVTITLSKNWNAVSGQFKLAYVEIKNTTTNQILSSTNLMWQVLPEVNPSESDEAHYINELQELIDKLQKDADNYFDQLMLRMSGAEDKLKNINLQIADIDSKILGVNAQMEHIQEQINSMNLYTKAEADAKFLQIKDLPTATTTTKGIILLTTSPLTNNTTTVPTSSALFSVNNSFIMHRNDTDNPHKTTAKQVGAIPTNGEARETVSTPVEFTTTPTINGSPVLSSNTYSCTTWQTLTPETLYEAKENTIISYRVITLDGKMKVEFKGALGRKDGGSMSGGNNIVKFPESLVTNYKVRRTTATNVSNIPCQLMVTERGSVYIHTNIAGSGVTLISLDGFSYWLD